MISEAVAPSAESPEETSYVSYYTILSNIRQIKNNIVSVTCIFTRNKCFSASILFLLIAPIVSFPPPFFAVRTR